MLHHCASAGGCWMDPVQPHDQGQQRGQQLIAAAAAVAGRVGAQQASVAALQAGGHAGRVPDGNLRDGRARADAGGAGERPGGGDESFAVLLAPLTVGTLADATSLKAALGVVPVMLVLAAAGLTLLRRARTPASAAP
jgi:hypothetical protein